MFKGSWVQIPLGNFNVFFDCITKLHIIKPISLWDLVIRVLTQRSAPSDGQELWHSIAFHYLRHVPHQRKFICKSDACQRFSKLSLPSVSIGQRCNTVEITSNIKYRYGSSDHITKVKFFGGPTPQISHNRLILRISNSSNGHSMDIHRMDFCSNLNPQRLLLEWEHAGRLLKWNYPCRLAKNAPLHIHGISCCVSWKTN